MDTAETAFNLLAESMATGNTPTLILAAPLVRPLTASECRDQAVEYDRQADRCFDPGLAAWNRRQAREFRALAETRR